jgi:dipeptidyl aminopeptidase/acylaminoacyl peptidase
VASAPADFSPDGSHLLYTSNRDSEFQRLWRYDLASGEHEVVMETPWDIMYGSYSDDGSYLVVGVNHDAETDLRVYDAANMELVELPTVRGANITGAGFSDDESLMLFYASASRYPANLFVQRMDGSEPRQLTSSLNPAIEPDDLVDGQVVRFASYDGLEIPGILYRPHEASEADPVPALVWVHGGPGGQSRIGYNALVQYLVNHGYAVYAINNRGSSGYGKTFFAMDDRKHGEADLGDVVASKQMLIETGWVDPDRVGIIGGSYGGYMVVAALAFEPEVFDVGVDIFGVTNWLRTLENIPPWWEAQRASLEQEMGDFDDEEFFLAKSPLFHATNIVRPLMVLQGANDPRVLKVESDEIVEAVRANGVPVEYLLFEDEGHGFRNKQNRIAASEAYLAFLEDHLQAPEN